MNAFGNFIPFGFSYNFEFDDITIHFLAYSFYFRGLLNSNNRIFMEHYFNSACVNENVLITQNPETKTELTTVFEQFFLCGNESTSKNKQTNPMLNVEIIMKFICVFCAKCNAYHATKDFENNNN